MIWLLTTSWSDVFLHVGFKKDHFNLSFPPSLVQWNYLEGLSHQHGKDGRMVHEDNKSDSSLPYHEI
jgi:hypothetical protein